MKMTPNLYLLMTGQKLARVKVYVVAATNDIIYICDAEHGTALTNAKWRVQKMQMTGTGTSAVLDEVRETDGYNNLATNVSVVGALSFS